ncbi:MAG: hypothetical protein SFY66_02855 [Oculatellaceae cyanobacterium bins.114]|nr:hypothetical protein [Oculatellaceae cyanobacterium bins.114]
MEWRSQTASTPLQSSISQGKNLCGIAIAFGRSRLYRQTEGIQYL